MPTADPPTSPNPPRISHADWLDRPETQAVLRALNTPEHKTRAVGGAVRNALMGQPISDIDLATTAAPDAVMAMARAAGLKALPTGLRHGTVTVVANHVPFEVTTLREDVETDGRRATVAFTADWAADARRRDFTINALYCDADGTVFDPLGGYGDIVARRVRFIGDADARIAEDYLRILRFFRFNAEYASRALDHIGLAACVRGLRGLARISAERKRAELLKLLAAPRAYAAIDAMFAHGLLVSVLGAVPRLGALRRLIDIEAGLTLNPDPVRRLGVLALHVEEDAPRLAHRLRLSSVECTKIEAMAAPGPVITAAMPERTAKVALYHAGLDTWRDRVLAAWACAPADSAGLWRALYELPERWPVPEFPLMGADIVASGVPAGPRVGQIMRALEQAWIESGFALGRDQLLVRIDGTAD